MLSATFRKSRSGDEGLADSVDIGSYWVVVSRQYDPPRTPTRVSCLSACLFAYVSVCLFVCLLICLSVYLSVCLFITLFICLYVYLFGCLFIRLFICLSVCLHVYLFGRFIYCMLIHMSVLFSVKSVLLTVSRLSVSRFVYLVVCLHASFLYVQLFVCVFLCLSIHPYGCLFV